MVKPIPGGLDESWMEKAACRGPQRILFYAPFKERSDEKLEREAQAKAICGSCAVKSQCLNYVLIIKDDHGIWGGMSPEERRAIR